MINLVGAISIFQTFKIIGKIYIVRLIIIQKMNPSLLIIKNGRDDNNKFLEAFEIFSYHMGEMKLLEQK